MLHYQSYGSGRPVIFIHGFCEDGAVWKDFYPSFAHDYHVMVPDLPGFGLSSPAPQGFTITDVAQHVAEWMKTLDVEGSVVIGHSLGGYVTLELAKSHPQLLSGIGLFHSTAFADSDEKKVTRDKVIEFVEKHGVGAFADSFAPQLFYEGNRSRMDREIAGVVTMARKSPLTTVVEYTRAMRDRNDRTDVLKNWDKPLLFIAGDRDNSVPIEKSEEQIPMINNGTVRILENTGHMGMFEAKDEAIKVIRGFLSKVW